MKETAMPKRTWVDNMLILNRLSQRKRSLLCLSSPASSNRRRSPAFHMSSWPCDDRAPDCWIIGRMQLRSSWRTIYCGPSVISLSAAISSEPPLYSLQTMSSNATCRSDNGTLRSIGCKARKRIAHTFESANRPSTRLRTNLTPSSPFARGIWPAKWVRSARRSVLGRLSAKLVHKPLRGSTCQGHYSLLVSYCTACRRNCRISHIQEATGKKRVRRWRPSCRRYLQRTSRDLSVDVRRWRDSVGKSRAIGHGDCSTPSHFPASSIIYPELYSIWAPLPQKRPIRGSGIWRADPVSEISSVTVFLHSSFAPGVKPACHLESSRLSG